MSDQQHLRRISSRRGDDMCGAKCVYRWDHGHAADLRICERVEGPCPHPEAARAVLRDSAPCAAEQPLEASDE